MHEYSFSLLFCILTMLQYEAFPFVIHLSALYLLNRCLCLFHMSLKDDSVRAYNTVRHCRRDKVQTPFCFDAFSYQTHTLVPSSKCQRIE